MDFINLPFKVMLYDYFYNSVVYYVYLHDSAVMSKRKKLIGGLVRNQTTRSNNPSLCL